MTRPIISLIVPGGEGPRLYADAVERHGGRIEVVGPSETLPETSTGLLLAGESESPPSSYACGAVRRAISMELPILGIGWGMHAMNAAMGGLAPVTVEGHGSPAPGESVRRPIFLAPGAKLSHVIGGSGWVTVPSAHRLGIGAVQLSPKLLASAYAEDRVIKALEMPGPALAIGVQWRAHLAEELPRGFDNLLIAFIERAGFQAAQSV